MLSDNLCLSSAAVHLLRSKCGKGYGVCLVEEVRGLLCDKNKHTKQHLACEDCNIGESVENVSRNLANVPNTEYLFSRGSGEHIFRANPAI